jgi:anti-sigma regulatory factor (Ser/Thr protein kinase)
LAWYGKQVWDRSIGRIGGFEEMLEALSSRQTQWLAKDKLRGFLRVRRAVEDLENARWISYCLSIQHAFEQAGSPKRTARKMIGALIELEENIHLHSDSPQSGLIAFACRDGLAEIVIADRGIGPLASLRKNPDFSHLKDHGTALRTALQDGNSRFGSDRGGVGFHDLFVALANSSGLLRFRTGDYGLVIDGRSPNLVNAQLCQLANLKGFFISVRFSTVER